MNNIESAICLLAFVVVLHGCTTSAAITLKPIPECHESR
jgi:hypothetical protein